MHVISGKREEEEKKNKQKNVGTNVLWKALALWLLLCLCNGRPGFYVGRHRGMKFGVRGPRVLARLAIHGFELKFHPQGCVLHKTHAKVDATAARVDINLGLQEEAASVQSLPNSSRPV